jgi:4-amino-4-deoxy-L-arabinose transferase-like glycosyltransferase
MIQRIQSIWLFIAGVCALLTLHFSFYSGLLQADNQYHKLNGTTSTLLIIITALLILLPLIAIFLYKNRIIQIRLSLVAVLVNLVLLFLYYSATKDFLKGDYAITAGLHAIIIITLLLAARAINKDEKLIKDSDRLR